jgi:hypothetical protein
MTAEYEPIPVRLHPGDLDALIAGQGKRRKRKAARTNTFTLMTGNLTQQMLPQANNRLAARITATSGAAYISTSQAGAAAQGGGTAQIPASITVPYPVDTTDAIWVSAANGVTVSVLAIYEEDE